MASGAGPAKFATTQFDRLPQPMDKPVADWVPPRQYVGRQTLRPLDSVPGSPHRGDHLVEDHDGTVVFDNRSQTFEKERCEFGPDL